MTQTTLRPQAQACAPASARVALLKDHQELLDLVLEVGEVAKRLEALQHRLTEKLCSMAEHQGIEPDAVMFGYPILQLDDLLRAHWRAA